VPSLPLNGMAKIPWFYCRPREQNHAKCAIVIVKECAEEIHKEVVGGPVKLRMVEFANRGGINVIMPT
jgi:hypothetical protein